MAMACWCRYCSAPAVLSSARSAGWRGFSAPTESAFGHCRRRVRGLSTPSRMSALNAALIGHIPFHEPRDPVGDWRRRLEVNIAHEVIDIGVSGRHVARLHRHQLADGLLADRLLQEIDHARDVDRIIVADVIHAPWHGTACWIGRVAGPSWIGLRGAVDKANDTFDDIVDIGEIATHLAMIEQL